MFHQDIHHGIRITAFGFVHCALHKQTNLHVVDPAVNYVSMFEDSGLYHLFYWFRVGNTHLSE